MVPLRTFAITLSTALWTLPAYGTPTVSRLDILEDDRILSANDLDTFFNRAGCACGSDLTVEVTTTNASTPGTFQIVVGQSCLDGDGGVSSDCTELYTKDGEDLPGTISIATDIDELTGGCQTTEENLNLYAMFDENDAGQWTVLEKLEFSVDTEAPAAPEGIKVVAGETLAEVAFAAPDNAETGLRYQVLCRTSTTSQPIAEPPEPGFETAQERCGRDLGEVDAAFTCAEVQDTAASVTVLGLENYTRYTFEVVSIDAAGNPSDPVEIGEATPAPEEDLWERYKAAGGQAGGEHCFVATAAYGNYDHPQVKVLRAFRDTWLMTNRPGRWVVRSYYALSPPLAEWISTSDAARTVARTALWPAVIAAKASLIPLGTFPLFLGLAATVVLGFLCWQRDP